MRSFKSIGQFYDGKTNLHHLSMLPKPWKLFLRMHSSDQTFRPPFAWLPANAAGFWRAGSSDHRRRRVEGAADRSGITRLTCAWYGIVCSTDSTEKCKKCQIMFGHFNFKCFRPTKYVLLMAVPLIPKNILNLERKKMKTCPEPL